jgi:hypothetical protein
MSQMQPILFTWGGSQKDILIKVEDFCQLASHNLGSVSDLRLPGIRRASLWISFPQLKERVGGISLCTILPLFIFKCTSMLYLVFKNLGLLERNHWLALGVKHI